MDIAALINEYSWIFQAFIVVLCTLILDFFLRKVLKGLEKKLLATKTPWDEAVVASIRQPLAILVWILGISFAAEIVQEDTQAAIFNAVEPIRMLGVIIVFTWFLVLLVKNGEKAYLNKVQIAEKKVDRTAVDTISKLLRLSIFITSVLVALQTLGFNISGVLAFGGIGGIAVGFAAKDLLANFFGGMMLFLDRPFVIGDWIRSPDKEIEGVVESISWRLTCIRTFDKRPLYIPNATFSTISVENPSRMSNRRIYETIGIRYQDASKMAEIVINVKEMLRNHPEIDPSQTLIVNFNKFAPSSLDFFIYTFTKTTEWVRYHEIKEDVLLLVIGIIEELGAEIAFPTSTLHLAEGMEIKGEEPTG